MEIQEQLGKREDFDLFFVCFSQGIFTELFLAYISVAVAFKRNPELCVREDERERESEREVKFGDSVGHRIGWVSQEN